MRTIGLISLMIAGTLLGVRGANSAPADPGQVWSLTTPFGIIYGIIGRETVDYPTARAAGTIVVSTGQRRLYYVLGGGKAVRYAIAVGMEGYAWSGEHDHRQTRMARLESDAGRTAAVSDAAGSHGGRRG